MATPDIAAMDLLVAQSYTHATKGTNLYAGPPLPVGGNVPVAATFVRSMQGPPPDMYINSAKTGIYSPEVHVVVRDEEIKRNTALANARAAMAILDRGAPTGYVGSLLLQSEPTDIGPDANGYHLFSFSARLLVEQ